MNELNLIPYSLKEKKQRLLKIRQYAALCILLLLALFSGVFFPSIKLADLRAEENVLQNKINANKGVMEESKKVSSELASYNERIQLIDYISKNKSTAADKIKDIQTIIPSDIKLTSLNYTKEGITIVGSTINYNAISEFGANLQTSLKSASVNINSIGKDESAALYSFTINIKY